MKTAQDAIEAIHARLPSEPGAIGMLAAWWYNALFVYTAATVLVAARLHPSITAEVSEEAITQSWRNALDILHSYESYGPSARQIVATLEILFDKVPQKYWQHRSQPLSSGNLGSQVSNVQQPDGGVGNKTENQIPPEWLQNKYSGLVVPQTNIVDDSLDYLDNFEFSFDVNDLSWLNSVPYGLGN